MEEIKINQSNSKSGLNRKAKNILEAKKIVNELINEDTVSITIKQKEWEEGEPVTANGDKFSDVRRENMKEVTEVPPDKDRKQTINQLKIVNKNIYLDGFLLKGVKSFVLEAEVHALPELNVKMLVDIKKVNSD